jgi:hypothetical protein
MHQQHINRVDKVWYKVDAEIQNMCTTPTYRTWSNLSKFKSVSPQEKIWREVNFTFILSSYRQ